MPYHVFIERPRETSALAIARVAGAIASRYGLPSDAIAERMARGRFRVKADVDLDSARRIAADLETLGAVCTVEDATTGERMSAAPAGAPAAAKPPAAAAPRPPTPATKPSTPAASLPPEAGLPPPRPVLESGLAAARAEAKQDLGALGGAELAVATLDGSDEPARAPAVIAPPGSRPPPTPGARPAKSVGEGPPADLFAPPEAEEEIELAMEARPPQRPVTPVAVPVTSAPRVAAPPTPAPTPALPPQAGGGREVSDLRGQLERRPLVRFAVGMALALALGLFPAWLFAAVREGSAYDAPRQAVERAQQGYAQARPASAEEAEALAGQLDRMRAEQRGIMDSARGDIALVGGLIWLGASGLVGFLWIRRFGW